MLALIGWKPTRTFYRFPRLAQPAGIAERGGMACAGDLTALRPKELLHRIEDCRAIRHYTPARCETIRFITATSSSGGQGFGK
jgi:hypothetical protein